MKKVSNNALPITPDDPTPAPYLTDILRPDLDLIFVGAAASLHSARAHHWYAGPSNRFYLLLYQSGLTPYRLEPEEDETLPQYGIGLTCLHKHSASSANHLLPSPTEEQRETVMEKLLRFSPKIVCFNGKDVYGMVTGKVCTDWGEQEEKIGSSLVYVVQSSSGRADLWGRERLEGYREIKARLDQLK